MKNNRSVYIFVAGAVIFSWNEYYRFFTKSDRLIFHSKLEFVIKLTFLIFMKKIGTHF